MARKKTSQGKGRPRAVLRGNDLRQLVPAIGLMAVVLGTLLLGAVLQSGEELPEAADPPLVAPLPTVADDVPAPVPAEPDRAPDPAERSAPLESPPRPTLPTGSDRDLQARCAADFDRLATHRGRWTLQLMIACEPENAATMIEKSGHSDRLYVLPTDYRGRSCFRLCWGVYSSRDAAADARDIPLAIRQEIGSPAPREVAAVVP